MDGGFWFVLFGSGGAVCVFPGAAGHPGGLDVGAPVFLLHFFERAMESRGLGWGFDGVEDEIGGVGEAWYYQGCFSGLLRWFEFGRHGVGERCGDQMKEVMGHSFTFSRTRTTFVSFFSDAL